MTQATQTFTPPTAQSYRLGPIFGLVVLASVIATIVPGLRFISDLWGREEYSHVYLILPLAILTFIYRFAGAKVGGQRWLGIPFCVVSIAVMLVGSISGLYTISVYGALLGIFGLVWSAVGSRGMIRLAGPVLYLAFMIPLPKALYLSLSSDMQHWSSELGVAVISALGINVYLDGNIIDLGTSKLEVAMACNGLRYLFPLFSFGCLIAMLLEDAFWKKILLVLSTLPIAILMNAGRIAMIGVLVQRYGIAMAEGTQHEVEGFLVFFLCILMLLGEVWVLLRIGSRGRFLALDVLVPDRAAVAALARLPLSRTFLTAGIVLMGGAVAVAAVPSRPDVIPERQSLTLFPMQIGSWVGTPQIMEDQFLDMLHLTDYVLADYTNGDSADPVDFYVAYYDSQKFGIQSHSPQQCIPGGGWNILSQSIINIPSSSGEQIPVNRLIIERQGVRQLGYFWFDERGRSMTNEFQLRYYAIRDSLVRGRSDGALVRLVTPVSEGNETAGDARLQQFFVGVSSIIGKYVPN